MTLLVVLTFFVVAVAFGAMAVGVVLSGRRLKGSCGGVGARDCHCERAGVPVGQRACDRLARRR